MLHTLNSVCPLKDNKQSIEEKTIENLCMYFCMVLANAQ